MSRRADPLHGARVDCLQSDVGAAAFVRDWKAISAETEFAAADQADTDRAGAGDNDGAVRTTMGAETGSQSVADEANGGERMRDLLERRFGAPAPETSKTDPCVHQRKILALQSCLLGCGVGGAHDRAPRLVDAQPRRCRARAALAEHRAIFILDASAATAAAAVNAEIQW